jgi:hypothetical protein
MPKVFGPNLHRLYSEYYVAGMLWEQIWSPLTDEGFVTYVSSVSETLRSRPCGEGRNNAYLHLLILGCGSIGLLRVC